MIYHKNIKVKWWSIITLNNYKRKRNILLKNNLDNESEIEEPKYIKKSRIGVKKNLVILKQIHLIHILHSYIWKEILFIKKDMLKNIYQLLEQLIIKTLSFILLIT